MIKKLKNDVEKLIENNENGLVKLKGITLSRADLETISLFCDILTKRGSLKGYLVIGDVREVFEKYKIDWRG